MITALATPPAQEDAPPPDFPGGHATPPQASVMLRAFGAQLDGDVHPLLLAGHALAREHLLLAEARRVLTGGHSASSHALPEAVRALVCRMEIRAAWVEKVDIWARANFPRALKAPVHTSTFGEVIDGLARAWADAQLCGPEATSLDATRVTQRLTDLSDAYDWVVPQLVAGRLRAPLVSGVATALTSL